jgi:sporulation protein YlmC with PRC-barrel domain
MMAENVLDLEIRTTNGEGVGEVKDVIFDRQGKIREFIVDVGGFLGIGEKTVSVSPRELRFNTAEGYAVYQGTRRDLENKKEIDYYAYGYGPGAHPYPGYGYGYPPYGYYGPYHPYGPGYPQRGYYSREYGRYPDDRAQDLERGRAYREDQERRRMEDQPRYYQPGERRQMEGERGYYEPRRGPGMMQGMREGQRSSNLSMNSIMNANVRNQYGDDIGTVDNLVVDHRGRITHAVISVGGFLGIGDKSVAVPFDELENIGPYFVFYRGTEEQLESMPQFDMSQVRGTGSMERQGKQASDKPKEKQGQKEEQQKTNQ